MTLNQLLAEYCLRHALDAGSVRQYEIALRLVDRWHGGEAHIADIFTEAQFVRFHRWLQNDRAPTTVNNKRGLLVGLWKLAWKRKWATEPPIDRDDLPYLTTERRNPKAWTIEEVTAILRHVDAAPKSRHWSRDHWKALLLCLYDTGARIEALLACRWGDLVPPRLRLDPQNDKELTEHNPRLHQQTIDAISRLPPGEPDERLFGWHGTTQHLRFCLGAILRAAGLDSGRRSKFHRFRRTNATHTAIAAGLSVASRSLGHGSEQVTREHYVDRTLLPAADAVDWLPRPGIG